MVLVKIHGSTQQFLRFLEKNSVCLDVMISTKQTIYPDSTISAISTISTISGMKYSGKTVFVCFGVYEMSNSES